MVIKKQNINVSLLVYLEKKPKKNDINQKKVGKKGK